MFARPPVAGRVKTRLSPALPAAHTARLYAALLADTLAAAAAAPAARRVVYWREPPGDQAAPPAGFESRVQVGDDLGARLASAARELLAGGHRAMLVGSDCPGLTPESLAGAAAALETDECVIGAAADGGYWLIGLGREAPELFEGIDWSTDRVLRQTLARAADRGLSVTELPALADLDTPDDLARLIGRLAAGEPEACGPRLLEALRALSLAV